MQNKGYTPGTWNPENGRGDKGSDHMRFSMETRDLIENSRKKIDSKHIDLIAANNLKVAGAGFGVDTNVLTLITNDEIRELPMMSKEECADMLLDRIMEMRAAD